MKKARVEMKIGFLGETRFPVVPFGPGGLGRTTHAYATALLKRGHEVTLHALASSQFDGEISQTMPDPSRYDAVIDFSHAHQVSRNFHDAPVFNLIGDKECPYVPPNAVVETKYMQNFYPTARIIPTGLDIESIPFYEVAGDNYLFFMGILHPNKGYQTAEEIGKLTGKRVLLAGPQFMNAEVREYVGPIYDENKKFDLLGNAQVCLCPYINDAAPRTPLEAAACGTPTLCLSGDGTQEHVAAGISGFICLNKWDMAAAVWDAIKLDRKAAREWVKETHALDRTTDQQEAILEEIVAGARW
jgi:glycosyltransferase involved in cell wall biosynthesis